MTDIAEALRELEWHRSAATLVRPGRTRRGPRPDDPFNVPSASWSRSVSSLRTPDSCLRPPASSLQPRSGTVLIFLVAAMAMVGMLINALGHYQTASSDLSSRTEERLISRAMALSGIEILLTIAGDSSEEGDQFLLARERSLPSTHPAGFANLFHLPAGDTGLQYLPPLEYPPLTDIALDQAPRNSPPVVMDNDIRLPVPDPSRLPAASVQAVPGTSPPAVLPRPTFKPLASDTYYVGSGVVSDGSELLIGALDNPPVPAAPDVGLSWWGPANSTGDLPPLAAIQGDASSQKMPPPSLLTTLDLTSGGVPRYRCFAYMWYVKSEGLTSPQEHYFMTSGRVRRVYTGGGSEELGPEVAVSHTIIR